MLKLILAAALAATAGSAGVTATIQVGAPACGVHAFGASLFADSYGLGTLSKIDPATNRVVKQAKVAYGPCGMTSGAGSLWVEDYGGGAIVRVNPKTLKVVKRVRVGVEPWDVTFGSGSVWASNYLSNSVSRIDPATNTVVKTIALPKSSSPSCIRAGGNAIWVGSASAGDIYRIDPATNTVRTIHVGHTSELCVDPQADGIWVTDNLDDSVTVLDPTTYGVLGTIAVPSRPTDLWRGPDGKEWVTGRLAGSVSRLDPATRTLVDTITTGGNPFVLRAGFGDLWASDYGGSSIFRIHP